jgi:predicted acyltransferase
MNPSPPPSHARVAAIDAYRGLVMFLMLAEVLHLSGVARAVPEDSPYKQTWQFFAYHQTHVEWGGCSLHDLIQPSFSFLVGVALPFSLLSRSARGQKFIWSALHALWRAVILILLGVFLRSLPPVKQTNWMFTDTLSQIGLGYFFLFLLGYAKPVWQWVALVVILVGYWTAFAVYTPDSQLGQDMTAVKPDWPHHPTGFAAHWDKNTNVAMAFDRWFLNLFPREKPFLNDRGGYATLSFIPTLGTMILGLIAGGWLLRLDSPGQKTARLFIAGIVLLGAGLALDYLGVCPSVKRIWTPSWVLFSGGWCFLILAAFYAVTDWAGFASWTYPLRVIGANSILAYCMAHLIDRSLPAMLKIHLGNDVFKEFGTAYEPFLIGLAMLAIYWLILFWMYQRRIFLRI